MVFSDLAAAGISTSHWELAGKLIARSKVPEQILEILFASFPSTWDKERIWQEGSPEKIAHLQTIMQRAFCLLVLKKFTYVQAFVMLDQYKREGSVCEKRYFVPLLENFNEKREEIIEAVKLEALQIALVWKRDIKSGLRKDKESIPC